MKKYSVGVECRMLGDERTGAPAPAGDEIGLEDFLKVKEPKRPRKTRPPAAFDMAADLLVGGGREREIRANNGAQDAERLMQRLKAL